MPHLDHLDSAARQKLKAPENWRAFSFEVVGDDYLVIGDVPTAFYSRGPRKGRPKSWRGPGTKVILSKADVDAEISRYIETTGNCPNCFGSKEQFQSWSKSDGLKTRPCETCNATGKHESTK